MTSANSEWVAVQIRELGYVIFLVIGVSTVALGLAFGILGLAMRTHPPAPYMAPLQRYLLIGVGGLIMVIGVVVSWIAGRGLTR